MQTMRDAVRAFVGLPSQRDELLARVEAVPAAAPGPSLPAPNQISSPASVSIGGHKVEISGDPADCYFQSLQDHINSFSPLTKAAADLPNGSVIFDVGANIGLSAIALAIAAPHCRVVCFEPSPTNFPYLKQNVERFGSDRIGIHQVAASDRRTTLRMFAGSGAETWSGGWCHVVTENSTDKDRTVIEIPSIRLDDFDEVPPALIKIDVEGHEPEVIAGAARLIEAARPLICVEFNPWTLNAFGGHSPNAFATALFDAFNAEEYENAGALLHSTLSRGHIADVYLRLKEGKKVPTLPQMSWPPSALPSQ
jgi:FkbM family methyltransferase